MELAKAEQMAGRIAGLEAEVRRLRRLVVIPILMALGVAGLAAAARPRPGQPLVVGSIELRDEQGRLRGSFGLDRCGLPGLRLLDHRGLDQVTLSIPSDDTSALYFFDRGRPRVLLDSSIEGRATLRFLDADDRDRALLTLAPDGTPHISLAGGDPAARGASGPGDAAPIDDRLATVATRSPLAADVHDAATSPTRPAPASQGVPPASAAKPPGATTATSPVAARADGTSSHESGLRIPLSYRVTPRD